MVGVGIGSLWEGMVGEGGTPGSLSGILYPLQPPWALFSVEVK